MIKLYHCADARSFRPLWALEEIGLPYELELLPFPPRFLKREYLGINPLGTIPLMIDGETRMTESAAICQYLGDRYSAPPLIVARDEPAYGAYLNALHFGEATLTFPQTIVFRYGQLEAPEKRLPQAVADYTRWTLARMRAFETLMGGAEYVCAGRFTMADISVSYAVLLARTIGIGDQVPQWFSLHFDRVAVRPAFSRAKHAQESAKIAEGAIA